MRTRKFGILILLLAVGVELFAQAQQVDSRLFQEMRWRSIGPYRGAVRVRYPESQASRMSSTWGL